jgi:hypothetical protein
MMHPHLPGPWPLAVPGIGFSQSISVGPEVGDPAAFADLPRLIERASFGSLHYSLGLDADHEICLRAVRGEGCSSPIQSKFRSAPWTYRPPRWQADHVATPEGGTSHVRHGTTGVRGAAWRRGGLAAKCAGAAADDAGDRGFSTQACLST